MAFTFHHVHLRCEDLEGAVRYYEEMFDGKVDETVEVRGLKIVRMDIGGERIFLSPKLGAMGSRRHQRQSTLGGLPTRFHCRGPGRGGRQTPSERRRTRRSETQWVDDGVFQGSR